jgi:hypothetical protein
MIPPLEWLGWQDQREHHRFESRSSWASSLVDATSSCSDANRVGDYITLRSKMGKELASGDFIGGQKATLASFETFSPVVLLS